MAAFLACICTISLPSTHQIQLTSEPGQCRRRYYRRGFLHCQRIGFSGQIKLPLQKITRQKRLQSLLKEREFHYKTRYLYKVWSIAEYLHSSSRSVARVSSAQSQLRMATSGHLRSNERVAENGRILHESETDQDIRQTSRNGRYRG